MRRSAGTSRAASASATARGRSTTAACMALPKRCSPAAHWSAATRATMNAARIKGSHAAIKTGMLAAEAAFEAIAAGRSHDELSAYPAAFERAGCTTELAAARNFKLWFKKGKLIGQLMTGIEQWLLPKLGVKAPPWTLRSTEPDHAALRPAERVRADRLPQARWQVDFRPPVFGLHQQHEPRREPARAPDAQGCRRAGRAEPGAATPARRAATARPASTSS